MRRLLLAFFFFCLSFQALAQAGNEWIRFGQQYYKISVAKDGIYRLTYSALQNAGFPTAGDPRNIKLYHRGIEQAIFVSGEEDGIFVPGEFLEFYGRKNDGTLDRELYLNPAYQPHNYYNLYSDTTAYFLTLGTSSGKRMALDNPPYPGSAAETFHWDEKLLVLADQYSSGIDYGSVQLTTFDKGEGFMGQQILQSQTGSYSIEGIESTSQSSGLPTLEVLLVGRGPMDHMVELYAGSRFLATINFNGYASYLQSVMLEWTDISAEGKLAVNVKVVGTGGPDRASVAYIKVRYPQQLTFGSKSEKIFQPAKNPSNTSIISIEGPPSGARLYDVTDPSGVSRIFITQSATLDAVVSGTSTGKKLFGTNSFIEPAIRKISFRQINSSGADYVIVSHPLLRKPALGYLDPVKAYAEYRSLPAGGSHDTLVVNIDQLYDQFSYGEQTPLAIYRFVSFLSTVNAPAHLFFIGKGLDVYYRYYRTPQTYSTFKDFVPTAGYPASDMAFSAAHGKGNTIATGRISATSPQDVASYLNKIKEQESRPFDDLRRKDILHLSGGIYDGEPQLFRSYLKDFATVAESYHLGGKVKALAKQSTEIALVNVADEVNSGVGLITFFGHSASTSTDFDIGKVTDPVMGYNNKGKYPALLMNGCSAGSFFLNASVFGENWVNTPNRGAVSVIAHSYLGFASSLRRYSDLFYDIAFGDSLFLNKGLGEIQREAASRYFSAFGATPLSISQVQQMVLLGDPATKLFAARTPDFSIAPGTVKISSFNSEPVTALSDSLQLSFIINNFGKAVNSGLSIKVKRTLNDNTSLFYDTLISATKYRDTISISLPGKISNGYGNNTFEITVDAQAEHSELNEGNNIGSVQYFIPLSGTQNLYPNEFGIVNSRQVLLSLQHTDQLSDEREFLVQFDTTATFDSPLKKEFTVKGTVLASQLVDLLEQDSLAYYWRSKLSVPGPNESTEWDVSSFTYINDGPAGWAQVHFSQFQQNPSAGLVSDPMLKKIEFDEVVANVDIQTYGAGSGEPRESVSFKINGVEYNLYQVDDAALACRNNTINLIAFDRKTTRPYPGVYLTWSEIVSLGGKAIICGRDPYAINSYEAEELAMADVGIAQYVDNVSVGDAVIIYNIGNAGFSSWSMETKSLFAPLGVSAEQLNDLTDGEPVIIFARKGAPAGSAFIHRANTSPKGEQGLQVSGTVVGRSGSGVMESGLIGPAKSWNSFTVSCQTEEYDLVNFEIIAVSTLGTESLLFSNVASGTDLSSIDPTTYPFLRVRFHSTDETFVTSAQISKWLVTYEPVAEGLVLYAGPKEAQMLNEGETWTGAYRFVNISDRHFKDSLMVEYEISNDATFASQASTLKIKSPAPGDTTIFTVPFFTEHQDGLNSLKVFVNPKVEVERNFDNNVLQLNHYLTVLADAQAPVFDVTFDGRHLVNDEFVSPSPKVELTVWDHNPYLLKRDTTGVVILVAFPCEDSECAFQRVYFSDPSITWFAETLNEEFKVRWHPTNLPEGKFTFRATATDASGIRSGSEPYSVNFRIQRETSVLLQHPFPNPVNHKAYFSFTLTGESVPSSFIIDILNANGRLMHQISLDSEGFFHIGTNTFAWDAIDSTGAMLPSGLYFYKARLWIEGQSFHRDGKIVIAR